MGLYLSNRQLRQLGEAQQAMVDTAGSLDDWRRRVNRSLRRLMGADRTCFMLPGAGEALCYSDDTDPGFITLLQEAFVPNSAFPPDAYVMKANMLRAQRRLTAWHEGMFSERRETERTRFYNEMNVPSGARYMMGLSTYGAHGEETISIAYKRPEAALYSEDGVRLLQLIAPAFAAGAHLRRQVQGVQAALMDTLDLIHDAALVLGPDGEEIFRNRALIALCMADAESETILKAMRSMAQSHALPWRSNPGGFIPAAQVFQSRQAEYGLSIGRLPQDVYGPEAVLVLARPMHGKTFRPIEDEGGGQDPASPSCLPSADEIQRRFGLTPQEARAALLMAEGLTGREMGARMFISFNTARRYSEQVLRKLNVRSRSAVALRLLENRPENTG